MDSYDVFISFSSAQRPWVEALGENLKSAGKTVFLDAWELVPGRDWIRAIDSAIDASRAAVLIVSPEALESGWVREEYEKLKRRSVERDDFPVIPVIHSTVEAEFPFIGHIQSVDFRAPVTYRAAFARLIAGLEGRPPGPNPAYEGPLKEPVEEPQPQQTGAVDRMEDVRALLNSGQIVTVLTPAGVSLADMAAELRKCANEKLGPENVVFLAPAYVSAEAGKGAFFRNLGQQAGFGSGVASPDDFSRHIAAHLDADRPLAIIVTGFEQATLEDQRQFCGVIRSLIIRSPRLHVLVFGGEKLNAMKYADGEHSLFSQADEVPWPEPSVAEIAGSMADADHAFSDTDIACVAELSGSHPALARELLRAVRRNGADREALKTAVQASPTVWTALTRIAKPGPALDELARLVGMTDFGPSLPYIGDPLRRRLRWEGLLVRGPGGRLVWRSAAVRDAAEGYVEASR